MPLRSVQTAYGKVRGVAGQIPTITVFKGIPYAAPPVGALRFAPPKPPKAWEGERLCDTFAPMAMQPSPVSGLPFSDFFLKEFYPYRYECSEDCLYLNIWTPAKVGDERLPVLFWVHGGGFGSGYGHEMEFDGEALCKENVILVTINYRLNYFGFFAHPKLSMESPHGVSGNYGILDQIAALRWVHENIQAFGGDPENITIFGQSAGGASIISLLVTDCSKGLFSKAIIQSGAFALGGNIMVTSKEAAQAWGERFLEWSGKSLAKLREMPAGELAELFEEGERCLGAAPKLSIDGYVFKDTPMNCLLSGQWKDVPTMVGSVGGDSALISLSGQDERSRAAHISPQEAAFVGDALIGFKQSVPGRIPAYVYYFDPYIPGHDAYNFVEDGTAYHSAELWYVFGTLNRCWRPMDGRHYDLSRQMIAYWTNFAKTGNPNGLTDESADDEACRLPHWETFTREHPVEMHFTENGSSCRPVKNAQAIAEAYWG